MPKEMPRLLLTWALLLLIGGAEFGASFLPMGRGLRPLIAIGAVLMAGLVATMFMEVGRGPAIVRGFAMMAVFWLIVMLALGSADPLTRPFYQVPGAHVQ